VDPPVVEDAFVDGFVEDAASVRRAMEYYAEQGWTDELPVVPVTESYLAEFLALSDRDPGDVLLDMPHLNRALTVRLAAINAALAGGRPEYFPVVLAAWESLVAEGYPARAIWQSTTGTAPFLIVNGPVRTQIGLNSKGNVFGSGFRANATIGRAIARTGALIHETVSALVVLSPEHARLFAAFGWSKADVREAVFERAVLSWEELVAAGKEALSSRTRWRLPAAHPDALPVAEAGGVLRVLNSPGAVLVVVAGAGNSGVSAVVETFGPRGGPPPVVRVGPLCPLWLAGYGLRGTQRETVRR
jgi:hypothetical protein